MDKADSNVQKPSSPNFKDIEGREFGRWKVIAYAGSDNGARWLCKCQCGTVRIVPATNLFQGSQSCGCRQKESARETGKTLHLRRRQIPWKKHGRVKTAEYRAWRALIQRCTNPKVRNYADYGGRGIKVCSRWRESFEAFFSDVGPKPSDEYSIDRIDNDGNYEPGNVKWSTDAEQRANSRHPRKCEFQGEMLSMAEIGRRCGIKERTLRVRLVELHWTVERATTQNPRAYHDHAKS